MKKMVLGIVFLLVVGIVVSVAPDPGHGPGEVDWSQPIAGDLKVNGKVGIGTVSPDAQLHLSSATEPKMKTEYVRRVNNPYNNLAGVTLSEYGVYTDLCNAGQEGCSFSHKKVGGISFLAESNNWIPKTSIVFKQTTALNTEAVEVMRIKEGKVGIGTATPGATLEVSGSSSPTINLQSNSDAVYYTKLKQYTRWTSGQPMFEIYNGATGASGNVLIGSYAASGGSNTALMQGNVGIGTTDPGADKLDVRGRAYASGGWQTSNADYAEWFEKEGETVPGDIIGINLVTGKVRRYQVGDKFIGIHSSNAGIVGNRLNESAAEMEKTHVLVGLLGQLEFNKVQVVVEGRVVKTLDGGYVGVLLSNGKVLIGR